MSSRPHGRGMRGHHHHHQGGYGHRGGHWIPKGGNRGNRSDYHHQHNHGGRSPRPGMRHADPEKLLASLGPDAQLALTTAIINSVLKSSVSLRVGCLLLFITLRFQNWLCIMLLNLTFNRISFQGASSRCQYWCSDPLTSHNFLIVQIHALLNLLNTDNLWYDLYSQYHQKCIVCWAIKSRKKSHEMFGIDILFIFYVVLLFSLNKRSTFCIIRFIIILVLEGRFCIYTCQA